MALKLNFSGLSLGAAVDQQTGNLSVFEIIEEIRAPQVPVQIPSMVIAMAFEKTIAEEFNGKVFIHAISPDGSQAKVGDGELKVPSKQKRLKAVFRFGGFPLKLFGPYRLVVSWTDEKDQKQGEALFDFDVVQATRIAQAPAARNDTGISH